MTRFFLVCLGGAVGSGLRFLVGLAALALLGARFPWGTLAVNLVGSFAIAFVMRVAESSDALSPLARTTIVTGVLGGFTTYSAFAWDTVQFVHGGERGMAALYLIATVAGCLLACFAGFECARRAFGGG